MVSLAALVMVSSMVVGQTAKVDIPAEAQESLGYFVGDWLGEWKQGDTVGTIRMSVTWAPGNHCTIKKYEITGPDGVIRGFLLSGWDPEKKQVVDTAYESNGWAFEDRWTIKNDMVDEGPSKSIKPDGKVQTEKCRAEKKGPNEFTYAKLDYSEGNTTIPDLVGKYRRVSQKPK